MSSYQDQPYRKARRGGVYWTLIGTANIIDSLVNGNFKALKRDYNCLGDTEHKHVKLAKKELKLASRRLRAVANSINRDGSSG